MEARRGFERRGIKARAGAVDGGQSRKASYGIDYEFRTASSF